MISIKHRTKVFTIILFTTFSALFLVILSVKANNDYNLSLEFDQEPPFNVGQEFEVVLSLNTQVNTQDQDISIVEAYLEFNSSKIAFEGIQWEDSPITSYRNYSLEDNTLQLTASTETSDQEENNITFKGSTALATLSFEALNQGQTTLSLNNVSTTMMIDRNQDSLPTTVGDPLSAMVSAIQKLKNPLKAETISEFIQYLINLLFYITLALAPLMFIIGGYYYLTAAGDPDRIKTGRNILIYTGAGIGIMLLAKALISMIIAALGG